MYGFTVTKSKFIASQLDFTIGFSPPEKKISRDLFVQSLQKKWNEMKKNFLLSFFLPFLREWQRRLNKFFSFSSPDLLTFFVAIPIFFSLFLSVLSVILFFPTAFFYCYVYNFFPSSSFLLSFCNNSHHKVSKYSLLVVYKYRSLISWKE